MLINEQLQMGFHKILDAMPKDCWFQIHGSFRYTVYPGWKSKQQNNQDLHILYVWGGEGCYHMKDGTDIPLRKGVMVFIGHHVEHYASINSKDPLRIIGLRFGIYDYAEIDQTQSIAPSFYFVISPQDQQHYFDLTWRIHQLFHNRKDALSRNMCATHLYQLMFDFHQWLLEESGEKSVNIRLDKVRQTIEEHPYEKISIAQLAKEAGISIRYLQKCFKGAFWFTPKEYHMNVQMNMAFSLLTQYGLSVTEVAERIGYSDVFTFSKQFKKHFGYSPIQAGNRH